MRSCAVPDVALLLPADRHGIGVCLTVDYFHHGRGDRSRCFLVAQLSYCSGRSVLYNTSHLYVIQTRVRHSRGESH
jgi:hypothetical protein